MTDKLLRADEVLAVVEKVRRLMMDAGTPANAVLGNIANAIAALPPASHDGEVAALRAALEKIALRCHATDARSNWLAHIIKPIARTALGTTLEDK
jgi:hypothetical protein